MTEQPNAFEHKRTARISQDVDPERERKRREKNASDHKEPDERV